MLQDETACSVKPWLKWFADISLYPTEKGRDVNVYARMRDWIVQAIKKFG